MNSAAKKLVMADVDKEQHQLTSIKKNHSLMLAKKIMIDVDKNKPS